MNLEANKVKKLPLGLQNFRKIIEGDYLYVDKTQYIYNLINGASYYFLSRPRRFGKSLLLSTIAEAFGGDRELFSGLWIYGSDYDFAKHPVIRLDMSNIQNKTPDVLEGSLSFYLKICYRDEGFEYDGSTAADAFMNLILQLNEKYNQRVVVLIDEYDKPILDHINALETADGNRQVLRGFYGILKSMDEYLRLVFITGVTKFTKTSIFSGLNNLLDITMLRDYAGICGIPTEELEKHFGEYIERLAQNKTFKRYSSIAGEILAWYDGYSWDGESRLLNPYSLLNFFRHGEFDGYWYETGTPWFLTEMIKKRPESYLALKNLEIDRSMLDTFDIETIELEPLLFQTGYLTVKEVIDTDFPVVYVLDIPNREVKGAFSRQVVAALTGKNEAQATKDKKEISKALKAGDLQLVLELLRGLFASIPYQLHIKEEAYYHSIFYAVMMMLSFDMGVEVSVSRGRIDALLELPDRVYIMEFKYTDCPEGTDSERKQKLFEAALKEGMEQIEKKGYADRYRGSGKAVQKVAFAFLGRDEIQMDVK